MDSNFEIMEETIAYFESQSYFSKRRQKIETLWTKWIELTKKYDET